MSMSKPEAAFASLVPIAVRKGRQDGIKILEHAHTWYNS